MALGLDARKTAVAIAAVVIAVVVSLIGAYVVIVQASEEPPHMRYLVIA